MNVTLTTKRGNKLCASRINVHSSPPTYWEPGDYEEDWDDAELEVNGVEVAPESWRGRILLEALDKDGERQMEDY